MLESTRLPLEAGSAGIRTTPIGTATVPLFADELGLGAYGHPVGQTLAPPLGEGVPLRLLALGLLLVAVRTAAGA